MATVITDGCCCGDDSGGGSLEPYCCNYSVDHWCPQTITGGWNVWSYESWVFRACFKVVGEGIYQTMALDGTPTYLGPGWYGQPGGIPLGEWELSGAPQNPGSPTDIYGGQPCSVPGNLIAQLIAISIPLIPPDVFHIGVTYQCDSPWGAGGMGCQPGWFPHPEHPGECCPHPWTAQGHGYICGDNLGNPAAPLGVPKGWFGGVI